MKEIREKIHTEYIKLESLLKLSGISETGGEAKLIILDGRITVNGELCLQRGKKIRPGDRIEIKNMDTAVTVDEG